jgi:hypothetical protein
MHLTIRRGLLIAYDSGEPEHEHTAVRPPADAQELEQAQGGVTTSSGPHLMTALVTIGVGLVMCRMGFRERRLQARSSRGRCVSCGRDLGTRRRCPRCG